MAVVLREKPCCGAHTPEGGLLKMVAKESEPYFPFPLSLYLFFFFFFFLSPSWPVSFSHILLTPLFFHPIWLLFIFSFSSLISLWLLITVTPLLHHSFCLCLVFFLFVFELLLSISALLCARLKGYLLCPAHRYALVCVCAPPRPGKLFPWARGLIYSFVCCEHLKSS